MAKQNRSNKQIREPVPPDGGYGWIVLCACFCISFIIDGCMYSIGIILPLIKDHFRSSQDQVNMLTSLNTGFLFCSGPIVAALSNQFGIRTVVMSGAIVTSSVYVISAFSPSLYYIMIAYGIIGGISTGCTYIASLIIIAQYFDKLRGLTTGITMSGSGFGAFAFAPIAVHLINEFSWAQTLIYIAAILIQCCVFGAFLRPVPTRLKPIELQEKINSLNEAEKPADNLVVHAFTGSVASIKHQLDNEDDKKSCFSSFISIVVNVIKEITDLKLLVQNFPFLLITVSNFFVFLGYFIPFLYIPIRAKEINLENYGWVLSIIGIINIPSRLGFGFLADMRYLSPLNLNTLSALIGAISLWLFPFFNDFITQAAFGILFAIGIGGMNCLCTPYLTDLVGKIKFSNAMGILSLFRGFACFLGPFIGGFLSEKYSTLMAFYFSAVCFTIGFGISLAVSISEKCKLVKRKKDRRYNSV